MKRLKEKWGITSNFQLFIICIVFAITGSFSVLITKPVILFIFGDLDGLNPLLSWLLRILILFPIYQVLLLFFGFIFFHSLHMKGYPKQSKIISDHLEMTKS